MNDDLSSSKSKDGDEVDFKMKLPQIVDDSDEE